MQDGYGGIGAVCGQAGSGQISHSGRPNAVPSMECALAGLRHCVCEARLSNANVKLAAMRLHHVCLTGVQRSQTSLRAARCHLIDLRVAEPADGLSGAGWPSDLQAEDAHCKAHSQLVHNLPVLSRQLVLTGSGCSAATTTHRTAHQSCRRRLLSPDWLLPGGRIPPQLQWATR